MTEHRTVGLGDVILALIVMALMAAATYAVFNPEEKPMSEEKIQARITVDCVKTGLQYRGLNVYLQSTGIAVRDIRRAEDFRHHIEKLINYHQSVIFGAPPFLADPPK